MLLIFYFSFLISNFLRLTFYHLREYKMNVIDKEIIVQFSRLRGSDNVEKCGEKRVPDVYASAAAEVWLLVPGQNVHREERISRGDAHRLLHGVQRAV